VLPGLAITVGATWLLYMSGLFVLWTPLPLLYRLGKTGPVPYLVSALISLCGIAVLYWFLLPTPDAEGGRQFLAVPALGLYEYFGRSVVQGVSLIYFSYFAAMAGSLGWSHLHRHNIDQTFQRAIIIPVVMGLVAVWLLAKSLDLSVFNETRGYLLYLLDEVIVLGSRSGITGQELFFLKEHREAIVTTILQMIPAALIIGTLFTAWCNVLAARWWFPKAPLFRHLGSLSRWKLGDKWVWGLIGAGVAYVADIYWLEQAWLGSVAANLLWVYGALYFLQGLAIISFYLNKRRSFIVRVSVYGILILFFQVMAILVTVLGLLEIWFNFRKLSGGDYHGSDLARKH